MNCLIRCEQLSKTFWRVPALRQINLEIPQGSIYALIGPNGAGKTTLIKLLMNILQPTSGRAALLGVDSRRLSPREFASIGYVSENQELPEIMPGTHVRAKGVPMVNGLRVKQPSSITPASRIDGPLPAYP